MIMPIHHPGFVTADGEVTLQAKFGPDTCPEQNGIRPGDFQTTRN
jgi:hypothetical protein